MLYTVPRGGVCQLICGAPQLESRRAQAISGAFRPTFLVHPIDSLQSPDDHSVAPFHRE